MKRSLLLLLGVSVCLSASAARAQTNGAVPKSIGVSVTVAMAGDGTGTVNPSAGVHFYTPGETVTFSAFPDPGSFCGGWFLDDGAGGTMSLNSYSFTGEIPNADITATATFGSSGHTLTTDIDGDGSVDPPPGSYALTTNLEVTLTATPNGTATFDHWRDDSGGNFGKDNPLTVTMSANATRIAVFSAPAPKYTITVAKAGAGAGSMLPDVGPHEYAEGETFSLIAMPDPGNYFGGWLLDDGAGNAFNFNSYSVSSQMPAGNFTATATFETSGYRLISDIDGNGSVDPPVGFYYFTPGLDVTLLATPNGPAVFDHWRDDSGGNFGTDNPLTVTMNANATRIAVFKTPITGSVVINNKLSSTTSTNVTLALAWGGGDGAGVTRMRFSDNGSTWSAWETLKATRAYTLPAGDGYKTVRVQYRDTAGNNSPVFSDFIRLDGTPPTGSIIINDGAPTTPTQAVTLKLNWSDGTGTGVGRMRFSDNGSTWTAWETLKASRAHTLPLPNGYHTVRVQFRDLAGNNSLVYNDYIKLAMP